MRVACNAAVFAAVDASAKQIDDLLSTVVTLLPNATGLNSSVARLASLAVAEQSVQLYVACNAVVNGSVAATTPMLNSTFWALLPDVKAAGRAYQLGRPLGVWDARANLSAVTCLLYQVRPCSAAAWLAAWQRAADVFVR
jgi:hypothetical protein